MFTKNTLQQTDPILWQAIEQERQRQEDHIELIASENYVSQNVLAAQGSLLTNKYAEGYPGKRYYGGCEYVDIAENLAIERAKALFNADYANVQPHSGAQANAAAYAAILQPGDIVLGMDLTQGGHLTHGSPVNFSGKLYKFYAYGVCKDSELIDYEKVQELATHYNPRLIVAGFSAYSRIVDWQKFREIADNVGAYLLADIAHVAGLIAAQCYPSPVQIADITTTTTHKTLRGPRGGMILAKKNLELEKKLNSAVFPGTQGGPLMHVIAAKAVGLGEASQPEFRIYQANILRNAQYMAAVFSQRGFKVVSGGTDNHLFLVDLRPQSLTGKEAEEILAHANITLNKNTVPNDTASPFVTSGIRIGTPAITTRGFQGDDCKQVANWVCDLLLAPANKALQQKIKQQVINLCNRFPVYR